VPDESQAHPDFATLATSWELALQADGYAANTCRSYLSSLGHFADWLGEQFPGVAVADVTRDHMRAWVVHVRESRSSGTARSWFAGVRHFFRWAVSEQEAERDPTEGIKTPAPNDALTPVLKLEDVRALLATCSGRDFASRRDAAIIMLFVDGGLRLAELAGLKLDEVDVRDRIVYVSGKGTNRSGPRRRAVPIGVKAAQALDRYIRERRRHPLEALPAFWLGARNRGPVSPDGIDAILKRRAAAAGITGLHPHVFRHTWASEFRAAGGAEGDLMTLGGWRSRTMLDRYGRVVAADRARESYRSRSVGDKL
jgi:site-specific recombinase XerD